MKNLFKNITRRHVAIGVFLLSLVILTVFKILNNRFFSPEEVKGRIIELFHSQSAFQESLVPKVVSELIPSLQGERDKVYLDSYWTDLYEKHNTALFIYENDSLIYWNTSQVSVEGNYVYNTYTNLIVFKKRAIYTSLSKTVDNYKIVMLTEFQKNTAMPSEPSHFEFEFENHIPDEVEIVDLNFHSEYGATYPLTSENGEEWAKIYMPKELTKGNRKWENFLLGLAGYMFFLIAFAFQGYFKTPKTQGIYSLCMVLLSIIYLYLEATVNLSGKNYGIGLFDSRLYASGELFPSLGDYFNWMLTFDLWSIMFILYLMNFVGRQYRPYFVNSQWVYVLFGIIEITSAFPLLLIPGDLIKNSTLNLDFNFITSFNIDSLAGIGIILFAVIGYMIFAIGTYFFICRHDGNWTLFNIGRAGAFIIGVIIIQAPIWHLIAFAAFCFGIGFYLKRYYSKRLKVFPDFFLILYSAVCSLFVGFLLVHATLEKRKIEAQYYAEKVINQSDPVATYFFIKSVKSLQADTILKEMLIKSDGNDEDLINLAVSQHFNNYWVNYGIKTYYKSKRSALLDSAERELYHNFDSRLAGGIMFDTGAFNYLNSDSNYWQFIGRIPLKGRSEDMEDVLYLLFETKKYLGQSGLPEFLIKRPYYLEILQQGFQTGKYINGRLTDKSGSALLPAYLNEENLASLISEVDDHVYYLADGKEAVLIVDINDEFLSYVNTVCILFLMFLIIIVTLRSLSSMFSGTKHQVSMGSTFRMFVITTMSFSFLMLLINFIKFTRNEFNNFDIKTITDKGEKLKENFETYYYGISDGRANAYTDPSDIFRRLSLLHNVEVNYYNAQGKLVYSSRPEIFREQFRNYFLEPSAYKNLSKGIRSVYYLNESIGEINFISAYFPIQNTDLKIEGYLQVPYFSENAKKEADISYSTNRVVRYFTIFITLVLIAVLIASNRIVKPLEELRSKIIGLRLGKGFEPIEYKGTDEIAALVKAYNIAIADLEASAELLAKSEREKAWREMAKQVAHEIKNPLTPLKLNVQMLERAYFDGRDDFDERIKQFTKSTLEQIDTMAQIASDFSNFAKLDKVMLEEIDMIPVIKSVVAVFNSFMPNITVKSTYSVDKVLVKADKDLVIRIFNNLIKNACQAIGESNPGLIEVIVNRKAAYWEFIVKDNGPGISEEMKSSIFKPNFTTKSTGSGLGLAMVRNMVENMQGTITFESDLKNGTCFIILLPAID